MNSLTMPAVPWRRDAPVIALVGLAHCISHFSQLLLPPLFPWLKDAFQVSYTQLGFLLTIFFVVSSQRQPQQQQQDQSQQRRHQPFVHW